MNDCRFCDDMKEFRKRVLLIVIIALIAFACIVTQFSINEDIKWDFQAVAILVIMAFIVAYELFSCIYICIYSVNVVDKTLIVKTVIGKKCFDLTTGLNYSYKQISLTKYYLFTVSSDISKIQVRTKKPKEFVDILLVHNIQLTEKSK